MKRLAPLPQANVDDILSRLVNILEKESQHMLATVSRGVPLTSQEISKLDKIMRLLLDKKKIEIAEARLEAENELPSQELHQHIHTSSEELIKMLGRTNDSNT